MVEETGETVDQLKFKPDGVCLLPETGLQGEGTAEQRKEPRVAVKVFMSLSMLYCVLAQKNRRRNTCFMRTGKGIICSLRDGPG